MKELAVVTIPDYIRRVKIAEARREKHFEFSNKEVSFFGARGCIDRNSKIPKKYKEEKARYILSAKKDKWILFDTEKNKPVIANPRAAGTPRYQVINSQDLYSNGVSPHLRNKIQKAIKESFRPYLVGMKALKLEDYPVNIILEVHDLIYDSVGKTDSWDMDNRSQGWYSKCFQDLLKEEGIIYNDSVRYITSPPSGIFCPINDIKDRKLVFRIIKDEREIIKNNWFYKP